MAALSRRDMAEGRIFNTKSPEGNLTSNYLRDTSCPSWLVYSNLLPSFPERDGHVHLVLVTDNRNLHAIAGVVVVHHLRQILLVLYFLIVDGHDQISSQHDG